MAPNKTVKAQIIQAPSQEAPLHSKSIFLSGTTTETGSTPWRDVVSEQLSRHPVTIYNPLREDWGKDWDDLSKAPYREQLEWETEKLECSDVVCVHLHPATEAPISLLELGLAARGNGSTFVCVPKGYKHRANVLIVCEKFGVEVVDKIEDFQGVVLRHLGLLAPA